MASGGTLYPGKPSHDGRRPCYGLSPQTWEIQPQLERIKPPAHARQPPAEMVFFLCQSGLRKLI